MVENKGNLRIMIYGAGAIGGVVGGLLALSGTPVLLIGRPGNVDAINKNGLRLSTSKGTQVVRLPAVTTPGQIEFEPGDVIFLCVKSQDTEGAMSDLHAVVKDVPVFCFQNGVRNEEIVNKYFSQVYGVFVFGRSIFTRDGEVTSGGDLPGRLMVGRYPEGTDELVETIAVKLRNAGYEVVVTPEIMPYKWGKLVGNLTNAVGAITNSAGEEANRIGRAAQNEGREILAVAGVHWVRKEEPRLQNPKGIIQPVNGLFGTPMGSTWQSLVRRQGTVETEFLNGEIVRIARKLGTQAPINDALLHITEQMATNHELPGKYTPAQLLSLLKLG